MHIGGEIPSIAIATQAQLQLGGRPFVRDSEDALLDCGAMGGILVYKNYTLHLHLHLPR